MKHPVIATVHGGMASPKIVGKRNVGRRQIKIATVPQKIKGGYVGMNEPARRQLHIPGKLPYGEVVLWSGEHGAVKAHTIEHELIEEHLVRYGHLPRPEAHRVALKFERTRKTPQEVLRWYRKRHPRRPRRGR